MIFKKFMLYFDEGNQILIKIWSVHWNGHQDMVITVHTWILAEEGTGLFFCSLNVQCGLMLQKNEAKLWNI